MVVREKFDQRAMMVFHWYHVTSEEAVLRTWIGLEYYAPAKM